MNETINLESEAEFIELTRIHHGTFAPIKPSEEVIKMFIPSRGLDIMMYGPYITRDNLRLLVISWKSEGDASVTERLTAYAGNLQGVQWAICKWPRAEGNVNIGSLQLKKTHHRCMTIWYN